jgi:hypothetical protein
MPRDDSFRRALDSDQRAAPLTPYIDPGFVNHRLVRTVIGPQATSILDRLVDEIPPHTPDWQMQVRIDHIYTQVLLTLCGRIGVPSLGEVLARPEPTPGQLISSTERLRGDPRVYDVPRITVQWIPSFETTRQVELELSTSHIRADTLRGQLDGHDVHLISFIAHVVRLDGPRLVLAPVIMGGPWLSGPPEGVAFDTTFLHYDFFEHFIEDIDEFQRVREVPDTVNWSPMRNIREAAFKACLGQLLSDETRNDWGGEQFDHFTSHLHLRRRRLTAAFLLKGPGSGFEEMQPSHLGTNADQIVRLASSPAQLLVVQHCHDIGAAVRDTLRAFAVRPHNARRYCLIDGRDSFRLLLAYGLADRALEISRAVGRT